MFSPPKRGGRSPLGLCKTLERLAVVSLDHVLIDKRLAVLGLTCRDQVVAQFFLARIERLDHVIDQLELLESSSFGVLTRLMLSDHTQVLQWIMKNDAVRLRRASGVSLDGLPRARIRGVRPTFTGGLATERPRILPAALYVIQVTLILV